MDYKPPATVRDMIVSEKFYNWIIGPVGSGKSVGILMKILHHAQLQAPDPNDGLRKTRWVVVRNTMQQLKDTTLKTFFEWFPPGVAGKWATTDKNFYFRFGDVDCEVMFRSLDTAEDVHKVLSLEVTGAVIEEFIHIPKEIINGLASRCGRYPPDKAGGPTWHGLWGASNPGNEDNWWYDWMYADWEDDPTGSVKEEAMRVFEQPSGLSPQAENLDHLPGGVQYYHRQMQGRSKEWIRQFIEVKWGYSVSGKPVFPEFKRQIHVAEEPLMPIMFSPLLVGFDAGLTPSAIIGQEGASGQLRCLKEVLGVNMGARRFAREKLGPVLRDMMRFMTNPEVLIIGDPAFTQRSQSDERTVMQVLQEELPFARVVPARTNVLATRLDAVTTMLTTLLDEGAAVIFDPSMRTTISGLSSGYQYGVNSRTGATTPQPLKNKYSHPIDALQYLAMEASVGARQGNRSRTKPKMPLVFNRGVSYA